MSMGAEPFHRTGWSVGGIIAHAMVVRRQDRFEIGGRDEPEPDEGMALKALADITGQDPESIGVPLTRAVVISRRYTLI